MSAYGLNVLSTGALKLNYVYHIKRLSVKIIIFIGIKTSFFCNFSCIAITFRNSIFFQILAHAFDYFDNCHIFALFCA